MRNALPFLLTAILFLTAKPTQAQFLDFGVMLGGSLYNGDLSANSFGLDFNEIHPGGGLYVRYHPNRFLGIKGHIYHGKISGRDSNSSNSGRQERNLDFFSPITELGVQAEINIPGFFPLNLDQYISSYLFVGLGAFAFNPQTVYQGETYRLQPLGTEGQGINGYDDKYSLTGVSIPFGAGVKFAPIERLTLGFEIGVRKTFTDYLDDVSTVYVPRDILVNSSSKGDLVYALSNRTGEFYDGEPVPFEAFEKRGDETGDDWYLFTGITIGYTIFMEGASSSSRGRPGTCPRYFK